MPAVPPISLPDNKILARSARDSALMADVVRLVEWIDSMEAVTLDDFELRTADIAAATVALGCSSDEVQLLWSMAEQLGFITVDNPIEQGPYLARWQAGDDGDALALWGVALTWVLDESAWYDSSLAHEALTSLDELGDSVAGYLLIQREARLAELTELVDAPGLGDPMPRLVELLCRLGAATLNGDVVALTPLALAELRQQFGQSGIEVPVLPPVSQMTAAQLISDGYDYADSWVAAREPATAARELLSAAASANAEGRLVALQLIQRCGLASEELWRSVLDVPALRPYAKSALSEALDTAGAAWMLADTIASVGEISLGFSRSVPQGAELAVLDAMWQLPHPQAATALRLIGEQHPDKVVAKAARKAAFKAASRQSP